MKYTNQFFLLLFFLFVRCYSYGQENLHNCVNPEIISLPIIQDNIQEQIYYQQTDKYTYWYKLDVKTTGKLFYEISSISKEDDYEVLIYDFNGNNFCNDVVNKKIKPIISKSKGSFDIKQGEYYIGVLHLSGYGCGHILNIVSGNKQVTYKAIQNECVEEAMEQIVVEENIISEKINEPELIKEPIKLTNTIMGIVVNSNTQKSIEAIITILDDKGNSQQQVNSKVDSGFVLSSYAQNKIIVSIKKLGYEPLLDTFMINANTLKVALTPIKIGEKLIMYKIYFHPNTYVLKEESKKELLKLTTFMLENDNYSFEIQGHTNGNKTVKKTKAYANLDDEWNFKGTAKKLSKMRAEKIKSYLIEDGIKETRLQTVGFGGDKMIIEKPKNMKQAMQNIRVEVIVTQ